MSHQRFLNSIRCLSPSRKLISLLLADCFFLFAGFVFSYSMPAYHTAVVSKIPYPSSINLATRSLVAIIPAKNALFIVSEWTPFNDSCAGDRILINLSIVRTSIHCFDLPFMAIRHKTAVLRRGTPHFLYNLRAWWLGVHCNSRKGKRFPAYP